MQDIMARLTTKAYMEYDQAARAHVTACLLQEAVALPAGHRPSKCGCCAVWENKRKSKDCYTFRCQFNEKPRIILGCPGVLFDRSRRKLDRALGDVIAAAFVLGPVPRDTV